MSVRRIAERLGVSSTAVSLALKNSPRVSAQLCRRAQQLAKELGYVPNARLAELMAELRNTRQTKYHATLAAFSLYPEEEPWSTLPHLGRFFDGAVARAASHGYKFEYFRLKRPGMSAARLREILQNRGIQGLLCLGGPCVTEPFPPELGGFAVTTFAASIPGCLHRVVSHFAADARTLFGELKRRGYRRAGLIVVPHGDERTEFCYSSTLAGLQERGVFSHVPTLRPACWDEAEFAAWFAKHRPDVIVLHHMPEYTSAMAGHLGRTGVRIPAHVGIATFDMTPDRAHYSGIVQNFSQMGAIAAEMLIGRVLLRDFGPPEHPKIELVLGTWSEGQTLRRPRA